MSYCKRAGNGASRTQLAANAHSHACLHPAPRAGITVGGASTTVDPLECYGWWSAARTDRRSSVIALTRTGAATHADAQRLIAAELDARIGAVLSDRAVDQLHRAIARLRAAPAAGWSRRAGAFSKTHPPVAMGACAPARLCECPGEEGSTSSRAMKPPAEKE